ncbi:carbohydrate sulfotransferase 5-like isoform X2 [Portunus trituberculatus]|uniref:carbohydrate sulfotransferase 5-like isoform X2 n=1 Tax=Portunus trituberculatus TaxID=210409 RepID=UPI001E1CD093|nr:carbohydrate sulfotransferase 5-like isoform X2 [Portunus trituberculatus]
MELHSLRKQSCRTLLLALMGTSLLLFFITQSGMKTPFLHGLQHPTPSLQSPYPSRRIQDYQADSDDVTGQRAFSNDSSGLSSGREVEVVDETDLLGAGAERRTAEVLLQKSTPMDTLEQTVQEILKTERQIIREAMLGYSFHPALNTKRIEDLVPKYGGKPVRSLVITTWRSGSTFIGDVLQSHPGTYYHYEPLMDFDIKQVRHGTAAKQALHNLHHLLNCDYSEMDHYLNYGQGHQWLFEHNKRLWQYCKAFPHICWSPRFLTPFCKLFPFQSLKTVRLRLNLTTEFLQDKRLGVQVLLLVRDPRGTMQSRRHRVWCPDNPDCDDPAWLCQDLVSDFHTAKKFQTMFPNSFRMVRYEDLSFNVYNMTKKLFDFFHLSYHPRVQAFLDTHTKQTIGGVSSTFRDSKVAPIHWQQDLSWKDVKQIQSVCGKALRLWGYKIAKDEAHLRSFNPVGEFKNVL